MNNGKKNFISVLVISESIEEKNAVLFLNLLKKVSGISKIYVFTNYENFTVVVHTVTATWVRKA